MRLFFSALVLIYMIFFNEIEEASGMKRVLTRSKKKKDSEDSLLTSPTILPTIQIPGQPEMQREAIDLNEPVDQESSQQTRSKGVSRVPNKTKKKNNRSSQGAASTSMIQDDQIAHQGKEYPERENIDSTTQHSRGEARFHGAPTMIHGNQNEYNVQDIPVGQNIEWLIATAREEAARSNSQNIQWLTQYFNELNQFPHQNQAIRPIRTRSRGSSQGNAVHSGRSSSPISPTRPNRSPRTPPSVSTHDDAFQVFHSPGTLDYHDQQQRLLPYSQYHTLQSPQQGYGYDQGVQYNLNFQNPPPFKHNDFDLNKPWNPDDDTDANYNRGHHGRHGG